MPAYPAFALLIGSAMAMGGDWIRRGTRTLSAIAGIAAIVIVAILVHVHGFPTPGDISDALTRHPKVYSLSLGHMEDLTLDSFAYLRLPLAVAGVAFLIGAIGCLRGTGQRAFLITAVMMVVFFQAARLAMVVFDPYLSSRPLARAFLAEPQGQLITEGHYYSFSSVFFYADREGLLYSKRRVNLDYGSGAPNAPHVFIDDAEFKRLWLSPDREYFLAFQADFPHYEDVVGSRFQVVAASGGKALLTNHPFAHATQLSRFPMSASD